MSKEIIERAIEDGQFVKFKKVRDQSSPEVKGKKRYMGADWIIGIKRIGNLMYLDNNEGFIEVANQKECELLGVLYYYKKWKSYIWEQCPGIMMSVGEKNDCLEKVREIVKEIKEENS